MNERNWLSGEELKNIMIDGVLPDEYINEENLDALLDYEFEQMGDADEYYDMSVVEYCNDLLSKYYTDESYENRKQETYKKIKAQIKSDGKTSKKPYRTISFLTKRIIAVCVVAGIIVSVTVIDAFNFNLFDNFEYFTKRLYSAISGKEVQKDDINRIASDSKKYPSVDELEKAEKIDIIVPMWLPEDIEIESIYYHNKFSEDGEIRIIYGNNIASLSITLDSPIPNTDGAKIYEHRKTQFYVFAETNVVYWGYDGNFYTLECVFDITEYADKIIENIK